MAEGAVAVVEKQGRASAAQNHQVLPAYVAQIEKQSAGGLVENIDAGLRGDVHKPSLNIFIQAVGQAAGLADIYLVRSVIVDVADRDAVAAIDLDPCGGVESRRPVRNAA